MAEKLSPNNVIRRIRPRWFTSVMGTGIVANASATLPGGGSALHSFALVVWVLDAIWLALLSGAWALHALRYRGVAQGHTDDASEAPMYGATAMGLLTVGAGALIIGHQLIGMQAALVIDWTLWTAGTLGGVATTVLVPYLMFTRYDLRPEDASGAWLVPVVPPMVSAATGALLLPHLPAGQARETMLVALLALFGMAAVASALITPMIWSRLIHFKLPTSALQPALWIVLGPLGQSVTAAANLSKVAPASLQHTDAVALHAFALLYGAPVWGFAILWLVLVSAVTIRAVRHGLPFTLTWWSFVFPLGTVVTGTSGLALRTGSTSLRVVAAALLLGLVGAWLTVAVATLRAHWPLRGDGSFSAPTVQKSSRRAPAVALSAAPSPQDRSVRL